MKKQAEKERIEILEEKFQNFIETTKDEIFSLKTELNHITKLYNNFVKKASTSVSSKAEKLNETFKKVNEYTSEISSIKENVNNHEIEKGKESQKFKLNNLENQNEYLQEEWKGNSKFLTTKIEKHPLDANSTGLVHSYFKEKNYYKYLTIIWSTVFTLTMIVIVYYAVKIVTDTYEIRNALMNTLSRVTFSLPKI